MKEDLRLRGEIQSGTGSTSLNRVGSNAVKKRLNRFDWYQNYDLYAVYPVSSDQAPCQLSYKKNTQIFFEIFVTLVICTWPVLDKYLLYQILVKKLKYLQSLNFSLLFYFIYYLIWFIFIYYLSLFDT